LFFSYLQNIFPYKNQQSQIITSVTKLQEIPCLANINLELSCPLQTHSSAAASYRIQHVFGKNGIIWLIGGFMQWIMYFLTP